MKIKYFLFLVFLFGTIGRVISQEKTSVHIHISDETILQPQWVYLFSWVGNDLNLLDSCFITPEKDVFTMETVLDGDEIAMYWLSFEFEGPVQSLLFLNHGEKVDVEFSSKNYWISKTTGSPATEEKFNYMLALQGINYKIHRLQDSLAVISDETLSGEIIDSIAYYKKYMTVGYPLESLKTTLHPANYFGILVGLEKHLSSSQTDSLVAEMKRRFPDMPKIQEYPQLVYAKESDHSKKVREKYRAISARRKKQVPSSQEQQKDNSESISKPIKAYQKGDQILHLSLKGLQDQMIALEEITSDYILIDFWAGWCVPCRREIPYLKEALEEYPEDLTIYAISLDNRPAEWLTAIENDKSEMFVHVYSGNMGSPETKLLCNQFGIRGIPANFLLDKNRRIVATDLRGEDLKNILAELTGKE